MKSSELRIGNLISRSDFGNGEDRFETIIELGSKATVSGPIKVLCEYDEIKPIPLNEEWLLKLGFTEREDNVYLIEWGSNGVEFVRYHQGYEKFVYEIAKGKVKVLESVHQLQNLYFALTESELTIKDFEAQTF